MKEQKSVPIAVVSLSALILWFCVVAPAWIIKAYVFDCCDPPVDPAAARFPQNAQVTVYLNTTGLTGDEVTAITTGLKDWNIQNNNSGVKYEVVETTNPPPVGGNNTIVAYFINESVTWNGGAALNMHSGSQNGTPVVYGELKFWNNIRSGTPSLLLGFLRATARHEGGHGLGLANADDCPPGSTIMNPSGNEETFITSCDNGKINTQSAYPSPTPPLQCPPVGASPGSNYKWDTSCCCWKCFPTSSPPMGGNGVCWTWNYSSCGWNSYYCGTPLIVDTNGDGFSLTNLQDGVPFDLNNDGSAELLSWTSAGSDDAWLTLDRNGNGTIDTGDELFGNYTAQPEPPSGAEKNGFLALAEYDRPENGGNNDGSISTNDRIFEWLRLWQDVNHNGRSETSELHALPSIGIVSLSLDFKEARRRDRFGNQFRYRAKVFTVKSPNGSRYAWDVFLLSGAN